MAHNCNSIATLSGSSLLDFSDLFWKHMLERYKYSYKNHTNMLVVCNSLISHLGLYVFMCKGLLGHIP